jgi:hypothetical protein
VELDAHALSFLNKFSVATGELSCTVSDNQSFPLRKDCGYERSLEKEGKDDKKWKIVS